MSFCPNWFGTRPGDGIKYQHLRGEFLGDSKMKMTQRDFLKVGATMVGVESDVSAASEAVFSTAASPGQTVPPTTGKGDMLYRSLGCRGAQVSALGVGGHHLGDFPSVDGAIRLVHEAIDAGITFFDNCWEYCNGKTENIVGRALKGRRDKVFLMTKVCTHGRSGRLALQMLEESLRRIQTDHLDLWQIHGIVYDNDPELAYAKGGILEALDRAKQQGKVRFVGFTGHKNPAIHLKMLAHNYPFDTVQMPLNCFDGTYRSFEQQVLPELEQRGIAALGMKSLGGDGQPILHGVVSAEEALRYAMSLPVATTISGMDSLDVLRQNLMLVRGFKPMAPEEMQALRQRCQSFAADGHLELYKSTKKYDGGVGREQHGYPPPEQLPL
jgi:predicted aldo/keto reductase-like oxidoreductase